MWDFLTHWGKNKYRCACCGNEVEEYLPLPDMYKNMLVESGATPWRCEMLNEDAYSCPHCGAADRERVYALWIKRNLPADKSVKILDIAPAKPLTDFLRREFPSADYLSGDLFMENVDIRLDIMDMRQIESASVDFLICSHVLEHVPDDLRAMREIRRVLSPAGSALVVVPLDLNQQTTDEDADCQDVMERWRRFGQDDHIRKYAKADFLKRLSSAALKVTAYDTEYFGRRACEENAVTSTSVVYIAQPNG